MKGFGAKAPAFFWIDDSGESVGDDVEVGGDFQAVKDDVVAGVDDDGQIAWVHFFVQAEEEFRGAYSAGQGGDFSFVVLMAALLRVVDRPEKRPASEAGLYNCVIPLRSVN